MAKEENVICQACTCAKCIKERASYRKTSKRDDIILITTSVLCAVIFVTSFFVQRHINKKDIKRLNRILKNTSAIVDKFLGDVINLSTRRNIFDQNALNELRVLNTMLDEANTPKPKSDK